MRDLSTAPRRLPRRHWYSGLLITGRTIGAVLAALRTNRLAALIPVAVVLFFTAALLWFVHLVSPLAPFVYSLF